MITDPLIVHNYKTYTIIGLHSMWMHRLMQSPPTSLMSLPIQMYRYLKATPTGRPVVVLKGNRIVATYPFTIVQTSYREGCEDGYVLLGSLHMGAEEYYMKDSVFLEPISIHSITESNLRINTCHSTMRPQL